MIKTPAFWDNKGLISTLLLPRSGLWLGVSALRTALARKSEASLPVICVGNLSAGGTGKTPVVAYLYDWCVNAGLRPVISHAAMAAAQQPRFGSIQKPMMQRSVVTSR